MLASDASAAQIAAARPHPGVEYCVAPAEAAPLETAIVDLVTVAQALHWFDLPRFFAEACRVLRPGGVLAAWSYERCQVTPTCDAVIEKVFAEVEDYWPPERLIVENRYRDIEFPLPEIRAAPFDMQLEWSAAEMVDYLRTWSAAQRYLADRGEDPVLFFADELAGCWGAGRREVRWPLTLRVGRQPE